MSKLSYAEFKDAIAQANALELAGVIHLASSRLQSLDTATMERLAGVPEPEQALRAASRDPDVNIYLAGCTGLKQRSEVVGRPIYKIGTTMRRDVDGRIDDLSKVRYAGYDPASGTHRDGFDDYALIPFRKPVQSLPPGLELGDGFLVAKLPPTLSRGQFEARFRYALRSHSVSEWAKTRVGKAHLSARGVHAAQLPVLTGFAHGAVRAKELYVLSLAQMTTIVARAAARVCGEQSKGLDRIR